MSLPVGITARIILVRHGEPVQSAQGRCYGKLDVSLSQRGERQIEQTARWLQKFEIDAIYASPRTRAVESGKIIAAKRRLLIQPDESFAEINFGDFEGRTYEEVEHQFPEIYQKWMTAPTLVKFPNGESFSEMQARVLAAIRALKIRHQGETFGIVSHGGVNRIVLADALKMPEAEIFRLEQSYAAANVIDFYDDFPVLRILNRTTEISWR